MHGIIHRDLKPQNIMLKDGIPKTSDWGLRDYSEVLKHLSVLRDYAGEEEGEEIDRLIKELEYRVEKEVEFSDELVERIKVLVYRVKVGEEEINIFQAYK